MSARSFNIKLTRKQSNVKVIHNENSIMVKLYDTIVFAINCHGLIVLNSGGYKTISTKTCINRAFRQLGLHNMRVRQVKGEWIVNFMGQDLDFKDEMVLKLPSMMMHLNDYMA